MYVPLSASRGMGQAANCPSMEQLEGIVDPSDPCQQATSTASPSLYSAYQGALQQIQNLTNPPAAGSTGATNYTPLLIAGGMVVATLVVLKLFSK